MITRTKLVGVWLGSVSLLLGTGCVLGGITTSRGCSSSPTVWIETTEELRIDTTNLTTLQVRTHNGAITHTGRSDAGPTAVVVVKKKAGGPTEADAQEAAAALQIVSESTGDGVHLLTSKWSSMKRNGWRKQVSFEIQAPAGLQFDGETHNGGIKVIDVTADVKAVTHNGGVHAACSGGKLYAETHNGGIDAAYEGKDVTILTHNGGVEADLHRCGALTGRVETHNGGIKLVLGQAASTKLGCETHNGRITAGVPLSDKHSTKRKLTGVVGQGEGQLRVTTHNGSIKIKKAAG